MARAESSRLRQLLLLTAAVTVAGVTPAVPAERTSPTVKVSEAPDQLIDIGAGPLDRESGVRKLLSVATGRLAAHSEFGTAPGAHRTTFCVSTKWQETLTFRVRHLHEEPNTVLSLEPVDAELVVESGPEPTCRTVEANNVPGIITLVYLDTVETPDPTPDTGPLSGEMDTWEHRRNPAERPNYRVERGPAAQGPLNQVVPRLRADTRLGR